jgi:prepilin-type N-terminal cleavage/methylation domain-containing protein
MNSRNSDLWQETSDGLTASSRAAQAGHAARVTLAAPKRSEGGRHPAGFTLIELLVVISIMGIIAALSVPALKNLGKSNINVSAARQMLDDVARARQFAISQHTTVYMVFVKTNFWMAPSFPTPNQWWFNLTPAQKTAATNLCDKQLTGYTFMSLRSVGDQPGRGTPHYLGPWHSLPDGTFIASQKFQASNSPPFYISAYDPNLQIFGFSTANNIPFPTEDSQPSSGLNPPYLPYIAFNYLGQLTFDGQSLAKRDEYIPLAQGSVLPAIDVATKALVIKLAPAGSPSFSETPPGNSTNSMYNIIHIDRLTGRATLEYQRVK